MENYKKKYLKYKNKYLNLQKGGHFTRGKIGTFYIPMLI